MKSDKKRGKSAEKLFDGLLNIDEDMLIDAAETDNSEKLRAYASGNENGKKRKNLFAAPAFRRVFIIAAAAVLAFSLIFGGIMAATGILPHDETEAGDETFPENMTDMEIDSLDKLNYYGGKRVLETGRAVVLSDPCEREIAPTLRRSPTETREEDINDHVTDDGNMGAKDFVGSEDLSDETFRITLAINYFIDIPDNDKFLSKKVGAGRVEVMMTDLYISNTGCAMITFRNGDRFFSCLTEMCELRNGKNSFFTHLYIDGFHFYKDLREGVSQFEIHYDMEQKNVASIAWIPYNRIPKDAPVYPITIVENSVHASEGDIEFTLFELEEYFFGDKGDGTEAQNETNG